MGNFLYLGSKLLILSIGIIKIWKKDMNDITENDMDRLGGVHTGQVCRPRVQFFLGEVIQRIDKPMDNSR